MAQYRITVDSQLLHQLFLGHSQDSGVAKLLESILNQVLQAQVTEQLEAERYERTETGSRRQRLEQSPAVPHPVSVHHDRCPVHESPGRRAGGQPRCHGVHRHQRRRSA